MEMFKAADRGEVTEQEASLLVGIMLSAAADTTVLTMANTIRAFAEFPEQYQLVRANPAWSRPPSKRACAGIRPRGWRAGSRCVTSRLTAT